MELINKATKLISWSNIKNIFHGFSKWNASYVGAYLLCLAFYLKTRVLYTEGVAHFLIHHLPYQLLGLIMAIGLQFVIYLYLKGIGLRKTLLNSFAYAVILAVVITKTGIIYNHYNELLCWGFLSVIIGLLRIIEKNRLGIFADEKKNHVTFVLLIIFNFILVIELAYSSCVGHKPANVKPVTNVAAEMLVKDNMERLKGLEDTQWEKLSKQQKMDLLQTMVNIEACHLGINHPLTVVSQCLKKRTLACYDDKTHTVFINAKYMEAQSAHYMVEAVAHESYHAYQDCMVALYNSANEEQKKLLCFRQSALYAKEVDNYKSGSVDFKGYYEQALEADARTYAKQREAYYAQLFKKEERPSALARMLNQYMVFLGI